MVGMSRVPTLLLRLSLLRNRIDQVRPSVARGWPAPFCLFPARQKEGIQVN